MKEKINPDYRRSIFPVKLSSVEKELIKEKAKASGMKVGTYIRYMALTGVPERSITANSQPTRSKRSPMAVNLIPEINIDAYRQLGGIANNLNQIARALNTSVKYDREFDSSLTNLLKETIHTVREAALKITNKKK